MNAKGGRGEIRVELLEGDGSEERPESGYALGGCVPLAGDGIKPRARWRRQRGLPGAAGDGPRVQLYQQETHAYSGRGGAWGG